MQCVILAGGLGTRILPLTKQIPKALIEIDNFPFINYQLQWLAIHGVTEVILCIGHLGTMIRGYVQDGSNYNLKIEYVDEGEDLLGTAGALRLALDKLNESFLVIYGDSFLPICFSEIYNYYKQNNISALMTIYKNDNKFDKSNVILYDDKSIFYNKKTNLLCPYIDYGLSILSKDIIKEINPRQKYGLADLFYKLSIEKKLIGYEVFERFYEIGSFSGLNDFKKWLNE
jgi:NDP-sugar pyrophosphorylase family protein